MKRIRRFVASLLTAVLLFTAASGAFLAPTALAAPPEYQDPLGLLPDWALEGGLPQDPVASLLPPDPLAGLLPNLPPPSAPGLPRQFGQEPAQPAMQPPGATTVPTPPPAPDCDCTPDAINLGTGALSL